VGLHTTIRRNRGIDIGAACGQLAAELAGAPPAAAVARRQALLVDRSLAALRAAAAPRADGDEGSAVGRDGTSSRHDIAHRARPLDGRADAGRHETSAATLRADG
jgi:hypothetical protein